MKLNPRFLREDEKWICVIDETPGAMAYGASRDEALRKAVGLALHYIADQIEHGELGLAQASVQLAAA